MAMTTEKIHKILSKYIKPGEQLHCAAKARLVSSKAGRAAAALIHPVSMQGIECIVGLTNRHVVNLGYNFMSVVIKPRKAFHIPIQDIANIESKQTKNAIKLDLLLRNGKKTHFIFEGFPHGNFEKANQLVELITQARQQSGFEAQPASTSFQPSTQSPPPPQYQQQPPPPPPFSQPPLPPQTQQQPSPQPISCPQCSSQIEADSSFCESCGSKIEKKAAPNVCPMCGIQVKPKAKFCANCGNKL